MSRPRPAPAGRRRRSVPIRRTALSDPSSDDYPAALRLRGFSRRQAARLVALRRRYDRGEFRPPPDRDLLRFARYLVRQRWFDDWGPTRQSGRSEPRWRSDGLRRPAVRRAQVWQLEPNRPTV